MHPTFTVRASKEFKDSPRRLKKFSELLGKNISSTITKRLKASLPLVVINRGLVGATEALKTQGNWIVHTRKTKENNYISDITNPFAPYAGYLNRPIGAYPLPIDTMSLREWLDLKGIDQKYFGIIYQKIQEKGHKNTKGRGFVKEAMDLAIENYNVLYKSDVEQSWKRSI